MEKIPLSLDDLYRLKHITRVALSPDGQRVAMVVKENVKAKDASYEHLFLVQNGGCCHCHQLTRGASQNRAPGWSKDGRYLAFLSKRASEDWEDEAKSQDAKDPTWQVWLFDLEWGGEPRQLTRRKEGVVDFSWSSDGHQIVYSSRDPSKEQSEYLKSVRGEAKGEKKGPFVIRRTQHKAEGEGFLDEVSTHLFVLRLDTMQTRQLTGGRGSEKRPSWSPDGRWIAFVSNRSGDEDNNYRNDLWLMSPDGTQARRLTYGDMAVSQYAWSPASSRIAFTSSFPPEDSYALTTVWTVEVERGKDLNEPFATYIGKGYEEPAASTLSCQGGGYDGSYPLMQTPATAWGRDWDRPVVGPVAWLDEDHLLTMVGERGKTRLAHLTSSGGARTVFPVDPMSALERFSLSRDRSQLALVTSSPHQAPEVYVSSWEDLTSGTLSQDEPLTDFNATWLSDRLCASYRRVEFLNTDGVPVEALVAMPPGWSEEAAPCPLVVKIHGGPMTYDEPRFEFTTQFLAGQGYAVLMVNYRGSISYGEEFCRCIKGDWGPRENDDIMSGVDTIVKRGWADPQRLFCTGFSQGGIMTNWAIGQSNRFCAAVSEHGMWDYVSAFGTDDCHVWWNDDLGMPWHNRAQYYRMSPASAVEAIETPVLITAGEDDWRCPLSQAEQMYVALKKRNIPTELVVYQEEGHAISRPRRAIDRLIRMCRWFERYGGNPSGAESARGYPSGNMAPSS